MRGIPSLITDIRKVFTEMARMGYAGNGIMQSMSFPNENSF